MVLSTWMLHWWGTTTSPALFFTFNAAFGGLAPFLAGLWSFKARDYIAAGSRPERACRVPHAEGTAEWPSEPGAVPQAPKRSV